MLSKGYIHIYTGNGKGKTTAAVGQCIRAIGAGLNVLFVQFMKDYPYSELKVLEKMVPQLTIHRYGNDTFVLEKRKPDQLILEEVDSGLDETLKLMKKGKFDLVVLDEICVSIYFGLLDVGKVGEFLEQKPEKTELILTGRYCPESLLQKADLVTEMREIKHYFNAGIRARKGIES